MFIGSFWRKHRTFCIFKLLILAIIIIWLLNLFLFYHLRSLGYRQTTVNILVINFCQILEDSHFSCFLFFCSFFSKISKIFPKEISSSLLETHWKLVEPLVRKAISRFTSQRRYCSWKKNLTYSIIDLEILPRSLKDASDLFESWNLVETRQHVQFLK